MCNDIYPSSKASVFCQVNPSQPLTMTDALVFSVILPFLEDHIVGLTHDISFSNWPLSFNSIHFWIFHTYALRARLSSTQNNTLFVWMHHFTEQSTYRGMLESLPKVNKLWKRLLFIPICRFLCDCMFSISLGRYPESWLLETTAIAILEFSKNILNYLLKWMHHLHNLEALGVIIVDFVILSGVQRYRIVLRCLLLVTNYLNFYHLLIFHFYVSVSYLLRTWIHSSVKVLRSIDFKCFLYISNTVCVMFLQNSVNFFKNPTFQFCLLWTIHLSLYLKSSQNTTMPCSMRFSFTFYVLLYDPSWLNFVNM